MLTIEKEIEKFIIDDVNITPSKMLVSHIAHPSRLQNLNNTALRNIVIEYAPIHKKYRLTLDGPWELHQIAMFGMFLSLRIANKPELKSILQIE